jgi:sigma-B regulation protein RsbU (phosphoserine phosphatase)
VTSSAPAAPLFRTWLGRTLWISAGAYASLWIAELFVDLPASVLLLRKVAAVVLLLAGVRLAWVGLTLAVTGRFLWRVRVKLLLSYLFLGVVPLVLVLAFALAGGVVLYDALAAYLVKQGLDDVVAEVQSIGSTTAAEIGRNPSAAPAVLDVRYANWSIQFPDLSLAVLPAGGREGETVTAGPWVHGPAPAVIPAWVPTSGTFSGIVLSSSAPQDGAQVQPVIRATVPTSNGRSIVVVDLPVGELVTTRVSERTGAKITSMARSSASFAASRPFVRTVAFLDARSWSSGESAPLGMSIEAPVRRITSRIAAAQSLKASGANANEGFIYLLVVLAILFAIIQASALVMGSALARSITYAVHELGTGTERVRQGDFTHRIRVDSPDQLGDLADSFNRMSASIEQLLHVQREKQRLDDELRIAREIQRSLLPVRPPAMPGLKIADLCEPAREVGGDYYDFFELGPRRLGVLIADVSGKGTSAALYMAELKGLMLALSHTEESPKRLLTTVNHLLAEHLDNRSFITATYAVIDLNRMTLTCARAGHTPLIIASRGKTDVLIPGGMVLGLRLPGAAERFASVLDEHTQPLHPGDLIVLYTDGITEATDAAGEMFGDEGLARVLSGPADLDPAAIRERVVREVRAFVGDAEPHDDMTMVVMRIDHEQAGSELHAD